MCGRYAQSLGADEIVHSFSLDGSTLDKSLPLNWNIAPTNEIYIIKNESNSMILDSASWGVIAPWQKSLSDARASQSHAINARSESIHEKPTFRHAFRMSRCLIPATGYYEWATSLGKYESKQPFYIHSKFENKSLAFAGIYDRWVDSNGEVFESAAIITRPAVDFLATIHHRMPTFLPEDRWGEWLNPELNSVDEIRELLELAEPAKDLSAHPVSTKVNATRNNGAQLIEEIDVGEPNTLF